MVLKSGRYFIWWRRNSCSELPLPRPRLRKSSRIALGISATIFLATLNNTVHADAEDSDNTAASPQSPLRAGFMDDKSLWQMPIRYLGEPPPGIMRIYWYARFDTRFRTVSGGPRTLINFFEGDYATRANIGDVVAENIWYNLESLFSWYRVDHSTAHPVEHMQEPNLSPDAIHSVIKTAVKYQDESMLKYFLGRTFSTASKRHAGDGLVATTSSCMLSALYEDDVRLLHVTSLGNMRALLGRPRPPDADGVVKYDVHVLSADHTLTNPAERARIEALHPGEDLFQDDGRLLGRPYTRALGDGTAKWHGDLQEKLYKDYLGAPPDPRIKTPPYVSADPELSTIKVLPGDFLVMTSHWVQDCLTDTEVVGLVGAWFHKHRTTHLSDVPPSAPEPNPPEIIEPRELPVDMNLAEGEDKTVMWRRWNVPKRFVNVEPTPTAHVAHNAMGGADAELRDVLLQLHPAASEGNVKAVGVCVVFFQ
ncbi:phosphatase 2C-like domain-containing protein [Mycena metata]|uniref:Phosphatase 2C-like domain-containing protein n=1 Tax=Mycena metata TaxID=1033252 RepID=A0AAD7H8E9_9AGAR|nr:phosphatase 2C-like domain-containing protein [Mycena metata]